MEFEYNCEHKYSFVEFMSKLGGLFGLWVGISFIDTSKLIKMILGKVKYFLSHFFYFNEFLILFSNIKAIKHMMKIFVKLRILITLLESFEWKKFIKVLSLPLIVYQIWRLTDDYLKYPMDITVDWIPFRDSLNRLSDESIPAITVCYEHIFEKILFNEQTFNFVDDIFEQKSLMLETRPSLISNNISTNNNYIKTILEYYMQYILGFDTEYYMMKMHYFPTDNKKIFNKILTDYLDVENKSEFIEKQNHLNDKTLNDLNGTQKQFDFFSFITLAIPYTHFDLKFRAQEDIHNYTLTALQSLSPFGKCFTYLSKYKNSTRTKLSFDSDHLIRIVESRNDEVNKIPIKLF